jgi:hypothetical protein
LAFFKIQVEALFLPDFLALAALPARFFRLFLGADFSAVLLGADLLAFFFAGTLAGMCTSQ